MYNIIIGLETCYKIVNTFNTILKLTIYQNYIFNFILFFHGRVFWPHLERIKLSSLIQGYKTVSQLAIFHMKFQNSFSLQIFAILFYSRI